MAQVVPMHGADASWSRERSAFLQRASDDPVIQVPYSRRYQLLLLVAVLFAAAPGSSGSCGPSTPAMTSDISGSLQPPFSARW